MIKKLNRLAMIMLMAVLPIAFASCSDNEDEPQLPQPEVEGMLVVYTAQIDSAMLNYLDVTVEYIDYHGQTVTAVLDGKQWTQKVAFDREKYGLPTNLGVTLKIAKKQSPEYDGEGIRLDGVVELLSYTIYSDGTSTKNKFSDKKSKKLPMAVDRLDDFIADKDGILVSYQVNDIQYDENGKVVSPQ